MEEKTKQIVGSLADKASLKQFIYRKTQNHFNDFKAEISSLADTLGAELSTIDQTVEINYRSRTDVEAELKFGGDVLLFMMHTNIFNFPPEHQVHKNEYVQEDESRSYCGMIMIYDFLSDSIKYSRMNDVGYLIARIFINKDGHFFVQGKRQFSFLYNDFSQFELNKDIIKLFVQTAILHTIDFDLFVPPFSSVQTITLMQKMMQSGNAALKTGKRLGFTYAADPSLADEAPSVEEGGNSIEEK